VSKASSQRKWQGQPENRGYYRGPEKVQKVRAWRAAHPGYSKRPRKTTDALPDILITQMAWIRGKQSKTAMMRYQISGPRKTLCWWGLSRTSPGWRYQRTWQSWQIDWSLVGRPCSAEPKMKIETCIHSPERPHQHLEQSTAVDFQQMCAAFVAYCRWHASLSPAVCYSKHAPPIGFPIGAF
jgi:hypothetical protein